MIEDDKVSVLFYSFDTNNLLRKWLFLQSFSINCRLQLIFHFNLVIINLIICAYWYDGGDVGTMFVSMINLGILLFNILWCCQVKMNTVNLTFRCIKY